eukprot:TRINITY_DN2824_c0_g1_i1.p1 TRINITY_DN2824_c0_g1~~TRINITY_DN2824_c0_g1_i1.p1  ORF type:complete len:479 (-),score=146.88 TRINITY_DN2824_c0_g1_i1:27-1436(-)
MGGPPPPPGMGGPPPPPGMMGGPPPPPGMMGGGMGKVAAGPPRRVFKKPVGVNLKGLNWSKLARPKIVNSMWLKATDQNVELEESRVIEIFGQKPAATKTQSESSLVQKKATKVQLLDMKRSNNISIILSQFKMSHSEIRQALVQMDESKLDYDALEALKKCMPTDEETEMLASFQGDHSTLGVAEQFLLNISSVQRVSHRLNCFLFKTDFSLKIAEISSCYRALNTAFTTLLDSKKFFRILEYILGMGNLLNAGKASGAALGFKLESLLRLQDTKGTGGDTLVHYLVDLIQKHDPELLDWPSEVEEMKRASKESMSITHGLLLQQKQGLESILTEIKSSDPNDPFVEPMQSFYDEAIQQIELMNSKAKEVDELWSKVCSWFAEDVNEMKNDEFFSILIQFSTSCENAALDIERKKIQNEKKKAREAKKTDPEREIVDTLAETLQNSNVFSRRRHDEEDEKDEDSDIDD